jgi:CheY-like chemotaxis protein
VQVYCPQLIALVGGIGIPLAEETSCRTQSGGENDRGEPMTRKKILLVDDSNTILMVERMMLMKGPYDIVTASNGEEAIVKAVTEKPDLILMDVIMPKMDGFEAVRQIRQHHDTRDTPVIMVTTRSESQNVENGFESGCNDYVTKPINSTELLSKLRSYLGEAGA